MTFFLDISLVLFLPQATIDHMVADNTGIGIGNIAIYLYGYVMFLSVSSGWMDGWLDGLLNDIRLWIEEL